MCYPGFCRYINNIQCDKCIRLGLCLKDHCRKCEGDGQCIHRGGGYYVIHTCEHKCQLIRCRGCGLDYPKRGLIKLCSYCRYKRDENDENRYNNCEHEGICERCSWTSPYFQPLIAEEIHHPTYAVYCSGYDPNYSVPEKA